MDKLGTKLGVRKNEEKSKKKLRNKDIKLLKIKKRCFVYKTLNVRQIFINASLLKYEFSE